MILLTDPPLGRLGDGLGHPITDRGRPADRRPRSACEYSGRQ